MMQVLIGIVAVVVEWSDTERWRWRLAGLTEG